MCAKFSFKLHYLPGLTFAWFIGTILISYCISVLDGNVVAIFPFISDTGAKPPESCIFGILLNFGTIIMAYTGYVRYRQIDFAIKSGYIRLHKKWNSISVVLGGLLCFGVLIVAHFQETSILLIHLPGAGLIFTAAFPYFILQTWFSYEFTLLDEKLRQYAISKKLFYFRLLLVCSLVPLLIVECIFFAKALLSLRADFDYSNLQHITKDDADYVSRLISTITEWILVIILFTYFTTYTNEFKTLKFKSIEYEFKKEEEINAEQNV